ncbi:MAG: formylglycine-generating enzyme family protein [Humidesulfovibrio sp.]|uniref:formylglycine-generating enzyme family protein n=1 Tax=Humidesulfovibrio sp. TaxID=2910988 RepID=UPI0027F46841|nr:formylglycine-generating enzyme family protein [Humidesulfovibrio sp.]MDQ7834930.1 formylglycine-generating enzyme family protein [Humidesulfovibrio sp.]
MQAASFLKRLAALPLPFALACALSLALAAPGLCEVLTAPAQANATQASATQANSTKSRAVLLEPAPPEFRPAPGDPRPGAAWTEPKTGMTFLWVPTGCFVMGSPETEPERNPDEGPQHQVCLTGFWLGKTEVTQGQWKAVMGKNPSLIANGDDYPVDGVSWEMAKEYAAALGKKTGQSFRLPTEAEWEYAARAGTTTAYAFGDTISQDQACFEKRFSLPADLPSAKRKSRKSRRKVARPKPRIWPNMHTNVTASFRPNALGLHDMHGNVWEWCQDVYAGQFYSNSTLANPVSGGEGESRVLRGGSWVTKASTLRSANRSRGWPDLRTPFYGLRLVRPKAPDKDKADKDKPARISNR